jgi:hypothetical protein
MRTPLEVPVSAVVGCSQGARTSQAGQKSPEALNQKIKSGPRRSLSVSVLCSAFQNTSAETVTVFTPVKAALLFEFTTTMSVILGGTPPAPGFMVT